MSHTTVAEILKGTRLPPWPTLRDLVMALNGDWGYFADLHAAVLAERQQRATTPVDRPVYVVVRVASEQRRQLVEAAELLGAEIITSWREGVDGGRVQDHREGDSGGTG